MKKCTCFLPQSNGHVLGCSKFVGKCNTCGAEGGFLHYSSCTSLGIVGEEMNTIQDIKNPTRFQDLNFCFLERVALAMTEGFAKRPTDIEAVKRHTKDYLERDTEYALTKVGNAIKHLLMYNELLLRSLRGQSIEDLNIEDQLGHAGANLNMLAKWEETGILPNTRCNK